MGWKDGSILGGRTQAEALPENFPSICLKAISQQLSYCPLAGSGSMSSFMEVQSGIALSKLKQRLYYLNVIVTMAPLLGLLGTISGMISAFSVFNLESGQATAITGGVGEALIATAFGLCVAIISLAIHAYFTQRLDNIITDMEQCFSMAEAKEKQLAGFMGAGEAV